jgi:hypothetical protein
MYGLTRAGLFRRTMEASYVLVDHDMGARQTLRHRTTRTSFLSLSPNLFIGGFFLIPLSKAPPTLVHGKGVE